MPAREQSFERYLHDTHDLPLLDLRDEQQLVAQVVAGRHAQQQLAAETPCCDQQWHQLEQIIATGQQARELLIGSHLRLVVRVARHYTGRGVSLLDLIQEGNIGLMQAADHFDPQHGVRFATYAVWWIRHAITHALAEARHPVRLSDEVRAKLQGER